MYLKLTNGVPEKYSIGQLRRDNPQISFPKQISNDVLASYDVYPYTRPTYGEYDQLAWRIVDGDFEQDANGNWSLPWVLQARPLGEAQDRVRTERDSLISESDWRVIKAYERSENLPAEWELYRQALRDITAQEGFPFNVTWPTEPA